MNDEPGYQPLDRPAWVIQGVGPAWKAHLVLSYGVGGTTVFTACGRRLLEPHRADDYDHRCQTCTRQMPPARPTPPPSPPPSRPLPAAPTRVTASVRPVRPPRWPPRHPKPPEPTPAMEIADPQALVADLKRCLALLPRIVLMVEMGAYHVERGEIAEAEGELAQAETGLRRRLAQLALARASLRTVNGTITAARSQPAR